MRIAHFTTEYGIHTIGGTGTCINELYQASGPNVQFVYLAERAPAEPSGDQRVHYAGYYDMDVLNGIEFDVALFHYYGLGYLADDTLLRGRKLIYVVHSVPTTEPWNFQHPYGKNEAIPLYFERMCDRADLIVCVSEAECGKLLLLYPDLEWKTCVIHNGLSSAAAAVMDMQVRPERTRFGFLGRCDYRKGLREAVQALPRIPGTLLIACGDEDAAYRRVVEEEILRCGVLDRVRWVGRMDGDGEKAAFFNELDALIVPSRWEPFGYVALEALRFGVPPLISNRGGMAEIVGELYPYQFDPWDGESFVKCLSSFQNDPLPAIQRSFREARRHAEGLTGVRMAREYEQVAAALYVGRGPARAGSGAAGGRRYSSGAGMLGPRLASMIHCASSTPPLH